MVSSSCCIASKRLFKASIFPHCDAKSDHMILGIYFSSYGETLSLMFGIGMMVMRAVNVVICVSSMTMSTSEAELVAQRN
ncbi:hypothetical protein N665_0028s0028 [Sinapis alba]|nr:hypothetical protein N665_0028s0028 [Sinapis alba]